MSKAKRTKSGAGSAHGLKWEQGLLAAPFYEEGKWEASLVFVEGDVLDDYGVIDILAGAVNAGLRKLFSVVTKKDLMEQVHELGNPKGKKPKEIPNFAEICETCKMALDAGQDLPLPLLAKLLKFRLLDIKQKDMKRRDTEKRGGAAPPKSAGGKKGDKKERTKSPAKGKGGKKTPEPPSPKGDTKLRKRGEEDTDSKYIDDEPDDGPQHYILLSGFYYPHLLAQMEELGLYVDAVIQCGSQDAPRAAAMLATAPQDPAQPVKEDASVDAEAELQNVQETVDLAQFWKDLLLVLQAAPPDSCLHDLARLTYCFKADVMPESIEDPAKKLEYGTVLFEDVACLIYDLYDWKRQWRNYLANLRLLPVPLYGDTSAAQAMQDMQSQHSATPAAPPGGVVTSGPGSEVEGRAGRVPEQVDMRCYNDLMNSIPQESASVPLMLHCMLEQVVALEEEREPPSEVQKPQRADGLADGLAQHVSSLAFQLALSNEERQALAREFDTPKSLALGPKQPELIYQSDVTSQRLNHLEGMYGLQLPQAEQEMLTKIPMTGLMHLPRPSNKLSLERAARLQELMHFCATAELTQAEIDRAFKQFVFECMELSTVDREGSIMPSAGLKQPLIPWDDPYPYFRGSEDIDVGAMMEEGLDVARSATAMSSISSASSMDQSAPVDAAALTDELEAIKQTRPASARSSSPKSSRSRSKKRAHKGSVKQERVSPAAAPEPAEASKEEPLSSRPNSGILKSPSRSREGSATSRKSSQSVHFEHDREGYPLPQPGDEGMDLFGEDGCPGGHSITDVEQAQKRNLDQWCFAEHLEPRILQQVLMNANYTLPYMDTYYHRRDHSLLMVLHNPHNCNISNRSTWQTKLHSNVGFRNYLEHIADSIVDWTNEQEAKFQAKQLAKEVEQIQKDADDTGSRPGTGKGKKGRDRSKSPKKSASRAGRSSSRGSSGERPSSTNLLVREGSLKAQKEEMDRLRAEADEAERAKADKRAKSAQKKASKDNAAKDEKEKKSGSRSSSKSRLSKEVVEQTEPAPEEPVKEEPYWPFTGYDVGNNLIHMSGEVTTMFPADGAQIRSEKINFVQGSCVVRTSLHKNGHLYHIHVLDPKVTDTDHQNEGQHEASEKADTERSEKGSDGATEAATEAAQPTNPAHPAVGQFGSFSAQFTDGMSLALSVNGAQGECPEGRKYEPLAYCPPLPRSPSPVTQSPSKAPKGKDKGKGVTPDPAMTSPGPEEDMVEEPEEEPSVEQAFQQLYVTCPDGLYITYLLESGLGVTPTSAEDRRLVVRQSYPFKTSGLQECEGSRGLTQQESSRLITDDGTVIKFMTDGSVMLLYANGQVSEVSDFPTGANSRSSSPQRAGSARSHPERDTPTKKGRRQKSAKDHDAEPLAEDDAARKSQCVTTLPSGERLGHQLDGTPIEVKDALICVATDPQTGQSLHSRDDNVVTVCHPDRTTIVEHSDGTRITTYIQHIEVPVQDPETAETGEDPATETQEARFIRVECPGYATVKFDGARSSWCSTEFANQTTINVFPSGMYNIYHHDGTFVQFDKDGSAVIQPRMSNVLEVHDPNHELKYTLRHFGQTILETVDNEGNVFQVNNTGDCKVHSKLLANETGEKVSCQEKIEDSPEEGTQKMPSYKQHAPRFFIIHKDGSGTELLRYQDVAEYLETAEDDPMTAILTDPLTDHPGVLGITVLKPNMKDMSQKWLSSYTDSTIIPPGLTSRDFKTMPAKEVATKGPQLGHNVGQGLSIGTQVAMPPKLPVLRCPTVLELKQIIQYKPVSAELRERLTAGLQEYAETVQDRNEDSTALLVHDPRCDAEKEQARLLQDLKGSAVPQAPNQSRKIAGDVKCLYESATKPSAPSAPPTPQPRRTKADWERDCRERHQEVEHRKALQGHQVPPYFESELGKAFLLSQLRLEIEQEDKAPDMTALARELAENRGHSDCDVNNSSSVGSPLHAEQRAAADDRKHSVVSGCDPAAVPLEPHSPLGHQPDSYSPSQGVSGTTPSALRPGNPTPGHAMGQGSPAPVRPVNPTPNASHKPMEDRPGAPTPKEALGPSETPSSHAYPSIPEMPYEEEYRSHYLTPEDGEQSEGEVIMEPSESVRLPAYIHGGRPGAMENQRFSKVEDPVRRRVYTSSVAGATMLGSATLSEMRGFALLPVDVNFGVLKEGNTYAFTVYLKNTGIDSCRFKVRQPPPSTGLKVCYKPGPVAAGMKVELTLELYAIAVGVEGDSGVGGIDHNVEIVTETDHLYLPVTAIVLTAHEYEQQGRENGPRLKKAAGVRFVTNRPPGGQGIIRPRREGVETAA